MSDIRGELIPTVLSCSSKVVHLIQSKTHHKIVKRKKQIQGVCKKIRKLETFLHSSIILLLVIHQKFLEAGEHIEL